MSDTVIVSLISLMGTLGGTLGGILVSNRLTNFRIEELEKKVDQLGQVTLRVCELEKQNAVKTEELKRKLITIIENRIVEKTTTESIPSPERKMQESDRIALSFAKACRKPTFSARNHAFLQDFKK